MPASCDGGELWFAGIADCEDGLAESTAPPFSIAPSLGLLVEGLLSATVAAYLFFIISVQLPQVLERQHLGAFIVDRAESLANGVMGFLQMIAGSTVSVAPVAVTLRIRLPPPTTTIVGSVIK